MRAALLLSTDSFEAFFGAQLGLSWRDYVERYRNDWAWDYLRILAAAGVETTMYVASTEREGVELTPDGFRVRSLRLGRAYTPFTRFPVLRRTPVGRFAAQAVGATTLLGPLRAAMDADGAEALIVQEYWTARFDVLALRLGRPIVAVDQGLPDHREIKLIKRWSLPRVSAVLTQTEFETAKVARYGGTGLRASNGVDTGFFRPAGRPEDRDRHSVVTVARLHDPQKRLSDLLRAVAELGPPWRVTLLGSGPDEGLLRALAAELGLGDRAVFAGFQPDKERVRAELQRCGVFALPSAWEGLPVALLEAMACGAPVVGSEIPAIAEVVRRGGGLVVPVGCPSRLAGALAEADARRAELGPEARAVVEADFSESRLGETLVQVLAEAAR